MKVCHDCGTTNPDWRGFQRHHVVFKGLGGSKDRDVLPGNIVTLCAPCHSARHNIREVKSEPQWRER